MKTANRLVMRGRDAFIIVFLAVHVALAVTCYWRDAKTWGWQMFSNATIYDVDIERSEGRGDGVVSQRVDRALLGRVLSPRAFAYFDPAAGQLDFHRGAGLLLDAAARLPAGLCRGTGLRGGAFTVRIDHRDISEATLRTDVFQADCP